MFGGELNNMNKICIMIKIFIGIICFLTILMFIWVIAMIVMLKQYNDCSEIDFSIPYCEKYKNF